MSNFEVSPPIIRWYETKRQLFRHVNLFFLYLWCISRQAETSYLVDYKHFPFDQCREVKLHFGRGGKTSKFDTLKLRRLTSRENMFCGRTFTGRWNGQYLEFPHACTIYDGTFKYERFRKNDLVEFFVSHKTRFLWTYLILLDNFLPYCLKNLGDFPTTK